MITDITLLQVMSNRKNYETFSKYIPQDSLTKEGKIVLDDIGEYFSTHKGSNDLEINSFSTYFNQIRHIEFKQDERDFYNNVIITHLSDKVSTTGEELIKHYHKLECYDKIMEAIKNNKDLSEIESITSKSKKTVNLKDLEADMSLSGLLTEPDRKRDGYPWRLKALQDTLGGLVIGDSVVIAATPNTGKTAFLASEVSHMAQHLPDNKYVLWFNNEGPEYEIRNRLYQATLNTTYEKIREDIIGASQKYTAIMKYTDRIKVFRASRLTYKEIERIIDSYEDKVGLIVIDMLDKVHGFNAKSNSETSDEKYGRAYTWVSELAILKAPVIGTSQTCSLKKPSGEIDTQRSRYPDLEDLRGSRIAKQGDIRISIMIGKDAGEEGSVSTRFISSPKNKVGVEVKIETTLDKMRNRYV